MPRHVSGHTGLDEFCAGEMLGAEDRQRYSETQIAQGCDFVEAICTRELDFGREDSNNEESDGGGAHGISRTRDFKKKETGDGGGGMHADAGK